MTKGYPQLDSVLCQARRVTDTGTPQQCIRINHTEGAHSWAYDSKADKEG